MLSDWLTGEYNKPLGKNKKQASWFAFPGVESPPHELVQDPWDPGILSMLEALPVVRTVWSGVFASLNWEGEGKGGLGLNTTNSHLPY